MHAVFLRIIRNHPADDLPRLIYADWLEEQGDPRGEFIRLQTRLARETLTEDQRDTLQQRVNQLLETHRHEWEAEFLPPTNGLVSLNYRRGFVERVDVTADYFLSHLAELQNRTPLRVVRIVDASGSLRQILTAPHLPQVETLLLYLPGTLTEVMACELHQAIKSGTLRKVHLETDSVTPAVWELLRDLPNLHWGEECEPTAEPAPPSLPRILQPVMPVDYVDYNSPRQMILMQQQSLALTVSLVTLGLIHWFGQAVDCWQGTIPSVWPDLTTCLFLLLGLLVWLCQLRSAYR